MNTIELHKLNELGDTKPISIPKAHIVCFYPMSTETGSYISMTTGHAFVAESYEQVKALYAGCLRVAA